MPALERHGPALPSQRLDPTLARLSLPDPA